MNLYKVCIEFKKPTYIEKQNEPIKKFSVFLVEKKSNCKGVT